MSIASFHAVTAHFGGPLLLNRVDFHIEEGERICLVGRNGVGKSTLLRILHGDLEPDGGEVVLSPGIRIGFLEQEVPGTVPGTIFDVVAAACGPQKENQKQPKTEEGWKRNARIEKTLSLLELDPEAVFGTLSSGYKRRVFLARELVRDPDILLLDEPTNHLDINSIEWLESFLLRFKKNLLFVTHDRVITRTLATRIIDLDRGRLTSWSCSYDLYVERKEEALEVETVQREKFTKRLAGEEAWIRRGVRERRRRNQGRVKELLRMREERRKWRSDPGKVQMEAHQGELSGRRVVKAERISFSYGDARVFHDFSTIIMRGDKVGIIGPNGAGKTTLLRVLTGDLEPHEGAITFGSRLQIAYFDQLREQLDGDRSVADNIADGMQTLDINGAKRNIYGYLQDFLFSPDRAKTLVRVLSGGEKNRLLLARLFAKPSNVLAFDEPTNDLDMETLELLEELILDYKGTVFFVSHDRAFLNNVATSVIAFEGSGRVKEYVGGYDDRLRQRKDASAGGRENRAKSKKKPEPVRPKTSPVKLSYKEKYELEHLPGRIEQLEEKKDGLFQLLSDPELYKKQDKDIVGIKNEYEAVEEALAQAFKRWEELENKTG